MCHAVNLMNHAIKHKFALMPPPQFPPADVTKEAFQDRIEEDRNHKLFKVCWLRRSKRNLACNCSLSRYLCIFTFSAARAFEPSTYMYLAESSEYQFLNSMAMKANQHLVKQLASGNCKVTADNTDARKIANRSVFLTFIFLQFEITENVNQAK